MARTIGYIDIWRPGIVLTTITVVTAIVSRPEFLLFKSYCLIGLEKAMTTRNHVLF